MTRNRVSNSGYIFKFSKDPISLEVRKQKYISLSSAEERFTALTESSKEAMYLLNLLNEIYFLTKFVQIYDRMLNKFAKSNKFYNKANTQMLYIILKRMF